MKKLEIVLDSELERVSFEVKDIMTFKGILLNVVYFEESGQRNSDSEVKFYADGDLKSTHKFYDINDIHKLHKMIKSYLGEVK